MFGKPIQTSSTRLVQKVVQPQIASASGTTTPTSTPKLPTLQSTQKTVSTSTPTSTKKVITQKVLGETETFIETEVPLGVQNEIALNDGEAPSDNLDVSDRLLTSPKKVVTTIYIALGTFVLLALLLMVAIEIKRQHPKYIALGIALIFLICLLSFLYRALLFPDLLII
jgi:hypothetical protein